MTLVPLSQFLITELLCCDQLSDAAESLARIKNEDGDSLSQRLYDYLQLHEAWCVRSARRMGFAMTAELQRVRTAKAKWEARMKNGAQPSGVELARAYVEMVAKVTKK